MSPPLTIAAVDRTLAAFFAAMAGERSYQRAEKALTLHMLEHLAPVYFAERNLQGPLDEAIEALLEVPSHFGPKVDADEAMARLDALYLRVVRGKKPRAFDAAKLKDACARAGEEQGPLWSWLMGELAAPLGVHAQVPPGPLFDPTVRLYHATHVVLVDTRYFQTPARVDPQLAEALPRLEAWGQWDLFAECLMCLERAGSAHPEAAAALAAAQRKDGRIIENGSDGREGDHCTAASLIALAGALDLQRRAP